MPQSRNFSFFLVLFWVIIFKITLFLAGWPIALGGPASPHKGVLFSQHYTKSILWVWTDFGAPFFGSTTAQTHKKSNFRIKNQERHKKIGKNKMCNSFINKYTIIKKVFIVIHNFKVFLRSTFCKNDRQFLIKILKLHF